MACPQVLDGRPRHRAMLVPRSWGSGAATGCRRRAPLALSPARSRGSLSLPQPEAGALAEAKQAEYVWLKAADLTHTGPPTCTSFTDGRFPISFHVI